VRAEARPAVVPDGGDGGDSGDGGGGPGSGSDGDGGGDVSGDGGDGGVEVAMPLMVALVAAMVVVAIRGPATVVMPATW